MRWAALATLALLSAWLLLRFVGTVAAWLPYPYARAYTEGRTLQEVLLVKRGVSIYDPITPERYISGSNPPLYYWLTAPLVHSNPPDLSQPEKVPSVFSTGRALSLLAALLTALIIPVLALTGGGHKLSAWRKEWRALAWAAIGGALFLSLPPVLVWSARLEADMLSVALTAAGLLCVALAMRQGGTQKAVGSRQKAEGRLDELPPTTSSQEFAFGSSAASNYSLLATRYSLLALAAVFFTLAFFTKQIALAGPLATVAYLLLRDWQLGLRWAGALLLLVGVPFLVMEIATGHWFYLKLFTYSNLPSRRADFEETLGGFWEDAWPLVLLATSYVIYRLVLTWKPNRPHGKIVGEHQESLGDDNQLLLPIFMVASVLLIPYSLTLSPGHSTLLMPGLAICACVSTLLVRLFANSSQEVETGTKPVSKERETRAMGWGPGKWAGDAALVLVAAYAILTAPPSSFYTPDLTAPPSVEDERLRLIIANAQYNSGPQLISDEPGIVALAGKETPYNDPQAMTANAESGRWDEAVYRERLRTGEFRLLVLSCDPTAEQTRCRSSHFTPGVLDALRDGYKVLFRDVYFTLEPK